MRCNKLKNCVKINQTHVYIALPPIISYFIKIQNGLLFWRRLTRVVLEKRSLNNVVVYIALTAACRPIHCTVYDYFWLISV